MTTTRFLLFKGKRNPEVESITERIQQWCRQHGVALSEVSDSDLPQQDLKKNQHVVLLSLGGDGTFLQAADLFATYRIPILGVNLGRLGFLSALDSTDLEEGLKQVKEGKCFVEKLTRLRCELNSSDSEKSLSRTALNELVFSRGKSSGLAELDLFLENRKVATYPGDGLIISTPTGSTAYSLSCGGPLITRNTPAFGIIPLNVHKLDLRPIVCSDEANITVETKTETKIIADGKKIAKVKPGNSIEIGKSATPTMMMVPESRRNFFQTVRNKLNWDKDRGTRS